MSSLKEILEERTQPGELYERLPDTSGGHLHNRVHCYACGHNCPIADGQSGVCKVRFNRDGVLYVPWGYTAGIQCDPVEKKPFFQYLAFNAPHFPLHAKPEDIKKYAGTYTEGWDQLRAARHKKQIELGVFATGTPLSPPSRIWVKSGISPRNGISWRWASARPRACRC